MYHFLLKLFGYILIIPYLCNNILILYRIIQTNIIMEKKRNNLRIAEIMQEKGLTLANLSAKIIRTDKDSNQRTITKATLSSRINGNPSLSNLYEIADALGVKITELFPEEDQWQQRVLPRKINMQTICPSCGAKISTTVEAE